MSCLSYLRSIVLGIFLGLQECFWNTYKNRSVKENNHYVQYLCDTCGEVHWGAFMKLDPMAVFIAFYIFLTFFFPVWGTRP